MSDSKLLFTLRNRLNFDPGGGSAAFVKIPTTSMIALLILHILFVCDANKFVLAHNAGDFDRLSNNPSRQNFPGSKDGDTGGGELFHSVKYAAATGKKIKTTGNGYAYGSSSDRNIHGLGHGDEVRFASNNYLSQYEPRNLQLLRSKTKFNDRYDPHQSSNQESRASTTLPHRLSVSTGGTVDSGYTATNLVENVSKPLVSVLRNRSADAATNVLEKRHSMESRKHDIHLLSLHKNLRKIVTTGDSSTRFFSKLKPHVVHEEASQKGLILRHLFRRQVNTSSEEEVTPPSGSSAARVTQTSLTSVNTATTGETAHASVHSSNHPLATPEHTTQESSKNLMPKVPVTKGLAEGATSKGGNEAMRHTDSHLGRASSTSEARNETDGEGWVVGGCTGSQCYASRFPYHWTSDASWALGSLLFLLCLLTFLVLYTGLWKKRNPMGYPFDGTTLPNPNRKVNITELLKTRLAMIPKHLRPKRHQRKRYEEIPLRPPNGAGVEGEEEDFFDDEEEDLYYRDQHLV